MIIADEYDDIMNKRKKAMHDATFLQLRESNRRKEAVRLDKEEFSRRIVAMLPVLYRVAWSQLPQQADREDAVQETIRRAWEKRGRLREERYMQTWVIRILLNVCETQRRKAGRMIPTEAVEAASARETDTPLLDALMALPEKYRLPLQLHYVEGYDMAETARMLHLPVGTVKSQLHRGRNMLREMLNEEAFEE